MAATARSELGDVRAKLAKATLRLSQATEDLKSCHEAEKVYLTELHLARDLADENLKLNHRLSQLQQQLRESESNVEQLSADARDSLSEKLSSMAIGHAEQET